MKVLWLCNIMLPAYARAHDLNFSVREGWLSGCFNRITKAGESEREVLLGVCFPACGEIASSSEVIDGVTYYGFEEDLNHPENYDEALENRFAQILEDFKPDIVHIFGTEFPHALAMLKSFDDSKKVLLGIQGLCGRIADEYMAMLPESVQRSATFRDRLKEDSLLQQQEKYRIRGEREKETILLAGNITGRTEFDRKETSAINPNARYFAMNETMRPAFYEGKWQEKNAIPHSIFLSQGDYPLKGFHFMLEAMPKILEKYPDAHLYVAGNNIIGKGQSKYPYFLRASAYGKYLRGLISSGKLKKKVTMVGMLSEQEMKEKMLQSSIFVCPSILENSPNSLAEAMLLGMPIVAARVGGIPSMIQNNKECTFFEGGNSDQLADAIIQMWDEPVISAVYGDNARKHALISHDPDANYQKLMQIYREIVDHKG
ncbi:glycosyltransferase family 4 protein [Butyrivibrio sp. INlla14]|uniref:glycosyltransferase family 4 protein n=1 Tax=Butyrivibrio sp. INlla14 TaxID=1520808 RepID=UPI0008761B31|nr:glycosyltransferase family 4 protein [Butyrivibrio sp. INlla14]SCY25203.1 Glycosyl transferases group 1 [Butyrivibrio sp. INlla14]